MLRFAEELLLLLHDRDGGGFSEIPERSLQCALAGAVLMDLALENRIDTDPEHLFLVDRTPLGDELLDYCLPHIANANDTAAAVFWIEYFAQPEIAATIREYALDRLVAREIMERDEGGILSLVRRFARVRRYAAVDGQAGRDVTLRIMSVLFTDEIPAARDIMIISLVDACRIFERLLTPSEQIQVRERIDNVCQMDLIGRAVFAAIRHAGVPGAQSVRETIQPLHSDRRIQALAAQPIADGGGLPLIGNAIPMAGDIIPFLVKHYRKLGPVFRVRAFSREYTVLAGPKANVFAQRKGRLLFRSLDAYDGLPKGFGAHRMLIGMDGNEHTRLRQALKEGYSKTTIADRAAEAIDIAARILLKCPEGKPLRVIPLMRRIATEQIAVLTTGVSPEGYVDDLFLYVDQLVAVRALHKRPAFVLKLPHIRRARARVERLCELVLDAHRPAGDAGGTSDLIDDILALHRRDPQFLPETELLVACVGPFVAGLHTVTNVAAFMLYALLKYPEIMAGVRAEVDEFFRGEGPTGAKLRAMDVTHRTVMETLRLYRVAPGVTRTAVNSFEFAGHEIPAGTTVMLPFALPHTLPECFPEPERFDIDRYTSERAEHRQPGVYAPFGLGIHRCLGTGFAEAQLPLILATLLHRAEIVMHPPRYEMKINYSKLPAPSSRFRVKIFHRPR